jgi:hypothetical protein
MTDAPTWAFHSRLGDADLPVHSDLKPSRYDGSAWFMAGPKCAAGVTGNCCDLTTYKAGTGACLDRLERSRQKYASLFCFAPWP